MQRQPLGWVCMLLVLVVGCNAPLTYEKTKEIKPTDPPWEITIDGAKYKQTLRVEVSSPDAPVNVHVFLEKNAEQAMTLLMSGQDSDILLGKQANTEKAELKVAIPPSESIIIRIKNVSTKDAKVAVKVSN